MRDIHLYNSIKHKGGVNQSANQGFLQEKKSRVLAIFTSTIVPSGTRVSNRRQCTITSMLPYMVEQKKCYSWQWCSVCYDHVARIFLLISLEFGLQLQVSNRFFKTYKLSDEDIDCIHAYKKCDLITHNKS